MIDDWPAGCFAELDQRGPRPYPQRKKMRQQDVMANALKDPFLCGPKISFNRSFKLLVKKHQKVIIVIAFIKSHMTLAFTIFSERLAKKQIQVRGTVEAPEESTGLVGEANGAPRWPGEFG